MSRDNSQPIATPERVLDEMHLTEKWLLDVLDQRALLEGEPPLQASLAIGDGDPWRRVLLAAVNGSAAGLQNTG